MESSTFTTIIPSKHGVHESSRQALAKPSYLFSGGGASRPEHHVISELQTYLELQPRTSVARSSHISQLHLLCFELLLLILIFSSSAHSRNSTNKFKMPDTNDDRASLVNRQLPEMTLSTASNPLTAPQPPPENLSAAQRAAYRFQVKGNAIST